MCVKSTEQELELQLVESTLQGSLSEKIPKTHFGIKYQISINTF